jgi:hypothetical protein
MWEESSQERLVTPASSAALAKTVVSLTRASISLPKIFHEAEIISLCSSEHDADHKFVCAVVVLAL